MKHLQSVKLYKELESLIGFLVNRSNQHRPTWAKVKNGIRVITIDHYTLSAYEMKQKRAR